MDDPARLKRLRYRAWHRGTKEADLLLGGWFDARHESWAEAELDWFEALLEEEDVDLVAWAMGAAAAPARLQGAMMTDFTTLDFVTR